MSLNKRTRGKTQFSTPFFFADTSSTTGGGLSGVTSASPGLVMEYRRQGQSTWTSVTPQAGKTLGSYLSGGIVADTGLAGAYEVDFPDAAFASSVGVEWVALRIRGVTNMLATILVIELDAVDYQDAAAFGLSRIDQTIGSRATQTSVDTLSGYVDTEVAAIKAKTDLIAAFPANFSSMVIGAGSGHVAVVVHAVQAGAYTSAAFSPNWFTADGLASDAANEIATAVSGIQVLSRLDSVIEDNGSGQFRFNTIALEMAPAGGGGGGTDWTANERTAIRAILGVPASGTTPTDPSTGILDEIRDKTALITSASVQTSIPVTAQGQINGPLYIGDDYLTANGRQFDWTIALPTGFVAATSTCKFGMIFEDESGVSEFNLSGTVADVGSGNIRLRFELPRTTTGALKAGFHRWSAEIVSATGVEVTAVAYSDRKLVEWREKQT